MPKNHVKKGDTVLVLTGKDAGKKGKILRVDTTKQRAEVEGLNMVKRHQKPKPPANPQGGIIEQPSPIHVSNLMLVDAKKGVPTRVRYKREGGKKVRVSARSGEKV